MFIVRWEYKDGQNQDYREYDTLAEAFDGLAFWGTEYEDNLNWIQIEFPCAA